MYKIINKGRYPFHVGDKTIYKGEDLETKVKPEKHQDGIEIYEDGKLIINADGLEVSPEENQVKKINKRKVKNNGS